MSLNEWAKEQRIHAFIAYRRFRHGKLPAPARGVGGLILLAPPYALRPLVGSTRRPGVLNSTVRSPGPWGE